MIREIHLTAVSLRTLFDRCIPPNRMDECIDEYGERKLQLWECFDGDSYGYALTKIEPEKKSWYIVAAQGTGLVKFGRMFAEVARRKGLQLTAHTQKRGMLRLMARVGMQPC